MRRSAPVRQILPFFRFRTLIRAVVTKNASSTSRAFGLVSSFFGDGLEL